MKLLKDFQEQSGLVHGAGEEVQPLRQVGKLVVVQWVDKTRAIVPLGVLVHIERKGEGD